MLSMANACVQGGGFWNMLNHCYYRHEEFPSIVYVSCACAIVYQVAYSSQTTTLQMTCSDSVCLSLSGLLEQLNSL